jgi:hypothetical protein
MKDKKILLLGLLIVPIIILLASLTFALFIFSKIGTI